MTPTNRPTSPGWRCPPSPTRADVARIEGTIQSLDESAQDFERADFLNASARATEHAAVWRERLAEVRVQIKERRRLVQEASA